MPETICKDTHFNWKETHSNPLILHICNSVAFFVDVVCDFVTYRLYTVAKPVRFRSKSKKEAAPLQARLLKILSQRKSEFDFLSDFFGNCVFVNVDIESFCKEVRF